MFKFLFPERCYNGGNKHNFQPRYSEQENENMAGLQSARGRNIHHLREILLKEVYEQDVCEWCGKVVKKQ